MFYSECHWIIKEKKWKLLEELVLQGHDASGPSAFPVTYPRLQFPCKFELRITKNLPSGTLTLLVCEALACFISLILVLMEHGGLR